jgi:hypothetical protein
MSIFDPLHSKTSADVLTTQDALHREFNEIVRRRAGSNGETAQQGGADETWEQRASRLHLTALCLSGGGIRSAAFCLGVLQALAARRLLNEFDYLSTVSGGGFIGGWLQMLIRSHSDINAVQEQLGAASATSVNGLRTYTNYLAPRSGPFSADTWAGIVLYLRNLMLNWMIFAPLFFLLALVPTFYRTLMRDLCDNSQFNLSLLAVAFAMLVVAAWQGATLLPSHYAIGTRSFASAEVIEWRVMAPALIWAWLVPFGIEFALARRVGAELAWRPLIQWIIPGCYGLAMLLGYLIAWAIAWTCSHLARDLKLYKRNCWRWLAATLCSVGLIWLGLHIVLSFTDQNVNSELFRDRDTHTASYHWAREHLFDYEHRLLVDSETALTLLFPLWLIVVHLLQTTF